MFLFRQSTRYIGRYAISLWMLGYFFFRIIRLDTPLSNAPQRSAVALRKKAAKLSHAMPGQPDRVDRAAMGLLPVAPICVLQ